MVHATFDPYDPMTATVDEAIRVLEDPASSAEHVKLACGTMRRTGLLSVLALGKVASRTDDAGVCARAGLIHVTQAAEKVAKAYR